MTLHGTTDVTESQTPTRWRTLWISDVHLGSAGCKAESLLDFLTHNEAHTLYLVGDIIDGWQLRTSWQWPRAHNDVIQCILRQAREGARVVFMPGNCDEFARHFIGVAFGDIEIVDDTIHTLADGRRLLVTHGARFDGVIQHGRWLACLGGALYQPALSLHHHFNRLRQRMGWRHAPLSSQMKHNVKGGASMNEFERALVAEARRRDLDGVVCGHVHRPALREVEGLLYCNDGDWVDSLSALAEDHDGKLVLLDGGHYRQPSQTHPKHSIKLPALPSTLQRGHIRENP